MAQVMSAESNLEPASDSATPRTTVRYRIDRHDRIVSLSDTFSAWAAENGAAHLADGVVGRSLWEFVGDYQTREVYRTLIARVREGRDLGFPYRCDAPHLRRFMRMTMWPDGEGGVWFESAILRVEPRAACWRLPDAAEATGVLLPACAWCGRVAVEGGWDEIEVAIARLDLFGDAPLPALTHGMCPTCYTAFLESFAPEPQP